MNKYLRLSLILCTVAIAQCAKQPRYHEDPIYRLENNLGKDGGYKYGFESPRSVRDEIRSSDGATKGYYAYIDDEGKERHVAYRADDTGYHVDGAAGVQDTPEVAAARTAHLEAFRAVKEQAAKTKPRTIEKELLSFFNSQNTKPQQKTTTYKPFVEEIQEPKAPVNIFSRSRFIPHPAVRVPETTTYFPEYPIDKEPCHGPLCNLKYKEVQSAYVTPAAPTHAPHHNNLQHQPSQQHFLRTDVSNLNSYRNQVPTKYADYSETLIAAARAYTDIISKRS